jgi:hypothetical protein
MSENERLNPEEPTQKYALMLFSRPEEITQGETYTISIF